MVRFLYGMEKSMIYMKTRAPMNTYRYLDTLILLVPVINTLTDEQAGNAKKEKHSMKKEKNQLSVRV